ncbi:Calvin cycle protein CP12-1 [Hibiscus syriacus]|uniref:Calvin cycle protein CP12-1 n=1 Tax=Hibiscus syriacus TaxID=106335 RepID=A0A6A3AXT7_HIBSY|nr:Calvin cycle protein CP12-1 [Hibiscus syriacus]
MILPRLAPSRLHTLTRTEHQGSTRGCSDDPASGECVAPWDDVEELSAAASHARDRMKENDPLETYCKDNPETDECKTYDN